MIAKVRLRATSRAIADDGMRSGLVLEALALELGGLLHRGCDFIAIHTQWCAAPGRTWRTACRLMASEVVRRGWRGQPRRAVHRHHATRPSAGRGLWRLPL